MEGSNDSTCVFGLERPGNAKTWFQYTLCVWKKYAESAGGEPTHIINVVALRQRGLDVHDRLEPPLGLCHVKARTHHAVRPGAIENQVPENKKMRHWDNGRREFYLTDA